MKEKEGGREGGREGERDREREREEEYCGNATCQVLSDVLFNLCIRIGKYM